MLFISCVFFSKFHIIHHHTSELFFYYIVFPCQHINLMITNSKTSNGNNFLNKVLTTILISIFFILFYCLVLVNYKKFKKLTHRKEVTFLRFCLCWKFSKTFPSSLWTFCVCFFYFVSVAPSCHIHFSHINWHHHIAHSYLFKMYIIHIYIYFSLVFSFEHHMQL